MTDRMDPDQTLEFNGEIVSSNGYHSIDFQEDGNLVLYTSRQGEWIARWSSRTWGKNASRCSMQGDGNLVIYDSADTPVWASDTYGNPGSFCVIQDDGNFVIYAPGGNAIWASNTVVSTLALTPETYGPEGNQALDDSCYCAVEVPPGHSITVQVTIPAHNEFAIDSYTEEALTGRGVGALLFERGNYGRTQDDWSVVAPERSIVVVTGWYKAGPPNGGLPWLRARASDPNFDVTWVGNVRTLKQTFQFEDNPGAGFGAAFVTAVIVGPM